MNLSFNGRPPVKKVVPEIPRTPRIPHPLRRSPKIEDFTEIDEFRRLLRRNASGSSKPEKDGFVKRK